MPMSQTTATALILARGGSKGLPGKNIRPLLGKPLIQYSIEAALGCNAINAVYVSTDDLEISKVAAQAGAQPCPLRPAALAMDTASSLDVVHHFLGWHQTEWGKWPDILVLLQPTSPLRNARHLQEAFELFTAHPDATIVSATPTKPLAWQGVVTDEGTFLSHRVIDPASNRQNEMSNFVLNGAMYIARTHRFWNNTLMEAPVYAYVMSLEESVDIDTLMDFQLAELLMAEKICYVEPEPILEASLR